MALKIMRGDACYIPIEIAQNETPVIPDAVKDIEVSIGETLQKRYSTGGVIYRDGSWFFRLSQEETFALPESATVYVRAVYHGDPQDVIGTTAGQVILTETGSKEVL